MGMGDATRRRRVHAALQRALSGVTLPSEDYTTIRTWVNEELPQLQAAGYTSYVVFGSYRGEYHRSLRIAQYELAKPTTATAVVLGVAYSILLWLAAGVAVPTWLALIGADRLAVPWLDPSVLAGLLIYGIVLGAAHWLFG